MLDKIESFVPFLLSVNGKTSINIDRVIEAIIIGVLAGFIGAYITVAKMEVRMEKLEKQVDKIYVDIYKPHIPTRVNRK